MSIFLTDPLIDSLRPKPPEEPDVPDYGGQDYPTPQPMATPDYGGQDYPSFPQAQVQQAPQLGTYTPEAAQPQPQPSFYQPGGAVGDFFSGLGSGVREVQQTSRFADPQTYKDWANTALKYAAESNIRQLQGKPSEASYRDIALLAPPPLVTGNPFVENLTAPANAAFRIPGFIYSGAVGAVEMSGLKDSLEDAPTAVKVGVGILVAGATFAATKKPALALQQLEEFVGPTAATALARGLPWAVAAGAGAYGTVEPYEAIKQVVGIASVGLAQKAGAIVQELGAGVRFSRVKNPSYRVTGEPLELPSGGGAAAAAEPEFIDVFLDPRDGVYKAVKNFVPATERRAAAATGQIAAPAEQRALAAPAPAARPPVAVPSGGAALPPQGRPFADEPFFQSHNELTARASTEQMSGKALEESLFGRDGASEYARLQRIANSSTASQDVASAAYLQAQAMERTLSPAQQNRLFGIGETGYNEEELKAFAQAAAPRTGDTPASLIRTVSQNLYRVRPDDMLAFQAGERALTSEQQIAAMRVREAVKAFVEQGGTPDAIYAQAISKLGREIDPADAAYLMREWIDLTTAARPLGAAVAEAVVPAVAAEAAQYTRGAARIPSEPVVPEPVSRTNLMSAEEQAALARYQAAQGGSTQPTAQRIVPAVNTAPWASASPEVQSAIPRIQDGLRVEVEARKSGTAEVEIKAGRSSQFGRVASNLESARQGGASYEETLAGVRGGLRVGQLRKTLAAPIELPENQMTAVFNYVTDALAGSVVNQTQGLFAMESLVKGRGLQPAQLKLIATLFGDEFASLARDATRGRITSTAALSPEAKARITAAKDIKMAGITKLDERALAQTELANDLLEKFRLDPTNARLRSLSNEAKAKGLQIANKAEGLKIAEGRSLAEATEIAAARVPLSVADEKIIKDAKAGGESSLRRAELNAQRYNNEADRLEALAASRENAPRYLAAAKVARDRADSFAAAATTAFDKLHPDEQALIDAAIGELGEKINVSSAVDREAIKSVEYWLKSARVWRQITGETTFVRMARISAAATGNLADAYLTGLYHGRETVVRALEVGGTDSKIAAKVGDLLVQSQLVARYPAGIPDRLAAEIAKLKLSTEGVAGTLDQVLEGMTAASQAYKNLAFGPADVGVLGQQGIKAIFEMAPTQILLGATNRLLIRLGHPLYNDPLMATPSEVAKKIQAARDGLAVNVVTGDVQLDENSKKILGAAGRVGRAIQAEIEWNTNFQFVRILGGLRNLAYEGNLALLDFARRDISDSAVRATAAKFANTATSAAPQALNARRRLAEQAFLMTPTMRRAQVSGILEAANTFNPNSTREERLLGAVLIVNKYIIGNAIKALLAGAIGASGTAAYVYDPSNKQVGRITTGLKNSQGQSLVVGVSPQDQIENAVAQSIRTLVESDPEELAKIWIRLGIGSSSAPAGAVGKLLGFGFSPASGYGYGGLFDTPKYGTKLTLGQTVAGLAPIPPLVQALAQGAQTGSSAALTAGGVQNFFESPSAAVDRGDFESLSGEAQLQGLRRKTWNEVKWLEGEDAPASFYEWYKKESEAQIERFSEYGFNPLEALSLAEKNMQKNDLAKLYRAKHNKAENEWAVTNPRLAYEILLREKDLKFYEKTFSPSPGVKKFVGFASQSDDEGN